MSGPDTRKQNEINIASMLRQLVPAIVHRPLLVAVDCFRNEQDIYFTVELAAEDLDQMHGLNRRTAESLAVIVRAAGLKCGDRCHLQFQEAGADREAAAGIAIKIFSN